MALGVRLGNDRQVAAEALQGRLEQVLAGGKRYKTVFILVAKRSG